MFLYVSFKGRQRLTCMPRIPLEQVKADPECWVDDYATPLFRYAMTQISDPDVAEDLVQETFLAALRARDSYSGQASFLTWLTSILRRKIVDHRRSSGRRRTTNHDENACEEAFDSRNHWKKRLAPWPVNSADQLETAEFWTVFEGCVSRLPPPLAEAFRLREVMSWSMSDICATIGISNGNLAVRLHRARLSLRGCLEERWFKD